MTVRRAFLILALVFIALSNCSGPITPASAPETSAQPTASATLIPTIRPSPAPLPTTFYALAP